jgi:hypothetical protein
MQIRPGWMTQRTAPNRDDFIREALLHIQAANCSSNRCPRRIR